MEGNKRIISWLPVGESFKVYKPELVTFQLKKRYFRQSHLQKLLNSDGFALLTTLLRFQLYHYGFECCEQAAFSHPLFHSDDESLSWSIGHKVMDDVETIKERSSNRTKGKPPPLFPNEGTKVCHDHGSRARTIDPSHLLQQFCSVAF
jgi:hypothetical protein